MFEPLAEAIHQLQVKAIAGCEIVPYAIGETAGHSPLYYSNSMDSTASLHFRGDTYAGGRLYAHQMVEVITLDDFLAKRAITRVDLLKMDVEGHELSALKGARESLQAGIIKAIAFEFGVSNINSRTFFRDYIHFFRELSFNLFRMTPSGRMLPVAIYSEDQECFARTTTYFAFRPE